MYLDTLTVNALLGVPVALQRFHVRCLVSHGSVPAEDKVPDEAAAPEAGCSWLR